MFSLPGIDIYQDIFDVYRVVDSEEGGITKHDRVCIATGLFGRCYQNPTSSISLEDTASGIDKGNQLMCDIDVDIRTGDEIIVYRSARIRENPIETTRYIAGNPNRYCQPFGGYFADLEHLQVALYNAERVE